MPLTVRALPTPFDPVDAPLTIATPSCCSCCCCCLDSAAMTAGLMAGGVHEVATANERSPRAPVVLAALAAPVAALVGFFFLTFEAGWGLALGITLPGIGLTAAAWHLAGARPRNNLILSLLLPVLFLALVWLELFVIFTMEAALWVWILAPLLAVAGWRGGRAVTRGLLERRPSTGA